MQVVAECCSVFKCITMWNSVTTNAKTSPYFVQGGEGTQILSLLQLSPQTSPDLQVSFEESQLQRKRNLRVYATPMKFRNT